MYKADFYPVARNLLILFGLSANLWGQGTAQINGVVKDATGLAVPGAQVKATQAATGAVRSVTTGADGGYTMTSLPIGPYVLEVSKEGFTKYVQSGIVLQVDANPTVDASLKVGSVTEQVLVQADAALVETHSIGVGQVVDSQRVVELPLNGRNATELIFLAGMANVGTNSGAISSVRNYPTVVVSVAGGQGDGITFLLDGANHNDSQNNLNLPLPFPDALQEFKVETSALPAQYGYHSAAAVNAVTKSGTNQFHGDAFEFLRNGDLNARDYFALTRDTLKRNQWGGVLGGPVKKDKLFFFAGYQGTSTRSDPPSTVAYVPTAAMQAGDFTAFASAACNNGSAKALSAGQGFAGNKISPSLLNPAALKITARLPVTADPCGKVTYGLLSDSSEALGVARVDYQKSDKHSMFARYYVANFDTPTTHQGSDLLTVNTFAAHNRVNSFVFGDTYLIGSGLVNSLHVGFNRSASPKIPDNVGTWNDFGVNANSFALNLIRATVTGGNGFAFGGGNAIISIVNTGPNPNLADDFTWIKGAHQFGFGGSYIFTGENLHSGLNATGSMSFNGTVTGLGMADFMVGQASSWVQGNAYQYYGRQHYIGLYAQDTWKVASRLTFNYGVRWEPSLPAYSKNSAFAHFDATQFAQNVHSPSYDNAPAGLFVVGDPQYPCGRSIACDRFAVFTPRVGLVWDPAGDGRTSVRAAFGSFTDRVNLNALTPFSEDAPIGNNITLANVNLSNPWATYPGGNPLPITRSKTQPFPTFGPNVTYDAHAKPTYLSQWSLSLQRQIRTDWLFTANYLGNEESHLITATTLNPAIFLGTGPCTIPGPAGVPIAYAVCSTTNNTNQRRRLYLQNPAQGQYYAVVSGGDLGGTGSYNGVFLAAQKRLSHGTTVLANYTLSHCISDVWQGYPGKTGSSSLTPDSRRNDRSNCATSDQRQVFNLSVVAQTPKFSNRALRILASDWQLSPIMKIKSAQFFTVTSGVDNALNGEGGQRPNQVAGTDPYVSNQGCSNAPCLKWITGAAFSSPALGTIGNLGAYNIKGPGVFQLDLAFSRTFTIAEKKTLQVRAETFNLPNHLNPGTPAAATNSGTFGTITSDISGTSGLSAGDPRIVQVALKFAF